MANWIALRCPTCGANLQVTAENDRFSCEHCGNNYLLEQKASEIKPADRNRLAPITTYTHRFQQWLKAGEYEIYANELAEEVVQSGRLIFVNVAYRNSGKDTLSCRRNQWVLYDGDGYTYDALNEPRYFDGNARIGLNGERFISPGMHLRGWIVFRVPPAAGLERLQFLTGFLGTKTIEFMLKG